MKHKRTSWAKRALLLAWELPQNVLGALNLGGLFAMRKVRRVRFERERLMIELTGGNAVSLGLFVFWTARDNPYVPVGPENRDHEYGHSIQSRFFGPLYLPIVGVPSSMRAGYAVVHKTFTGRRWNGYYAGWPERQADELGGADLSRRPPA